MQVAIATALTLMLSATLSSCASTSRPHGHDEKPPTLLRLTTDKMMNVVEHMQTTHIERFKAKSHGAMSNMAHVSVTGAATAEERQQALAKMQAIKNKFIGKTLNSAKNVRDAVSSLHNTQTNNLQRAAEQLHRSASEALGEADRGIRDVRAAQSTDDLRALATKHAQQYDEHARELTFPGARRLRQHVASDAHQQATRWADREGRRVSNAPAPGVRYTPPFGHSRHT